MMTHAEAVALIERTLQDYLLGRVRREPRLAEHLATLLGFTEPAPPSALPPETHQFYTDLNRRALTVDLQLARRHQ